MWMQGSPSQHGRTHCRQRMQPMRSSLIGRQSPLQWSRWKSGGCGPFGLRCRSSYVNSLMNVFPCMKRFCGVETALLSTLSWRRNHREQRKPRQSMRLSLPQTSSPLERPSCAQAHLRCNDRPRDQTKLEDHRISKMQNQVTTEKQRGRHSTAERSLCSARRSHPLSLLRRAFRRLAPSACKHDTPCADHLMSNTAWTKHQKSKAHSSRSSVS